MFYEKYIELCDKTREKPYKLAVELGAKNNAVVAQWKKGAVPRMAMLEKIADHFGVTIDYLITGEDKRPALFENMLIHGEQKQLAGNGELSADEINLIEAFRDIPDAEKQTFLRMIQQYVKHTP